MKRRRSGCRWTASKVRTPACSAGSAHGKSLWALALACALGLATSTSCGSGDAESGPESDMKIAQKVIASLVAACPMAAASDESARSACAASLTDDRYLASVMQNPFLWGGKQSGTSYHLRESNMTWFNTRVWRRMYLSLMMFPGPSTIEQTADGLTVAHLPMYFRNELDLGSYPYPFWHSATKWASYQLAREVILVVQNGKWLGAMRSSEQDPSRAQVAHGWAGQWQWQEDGMIMPYVSLYTYLLSPQNPHAARLDAAYRALADALRSQSCMACHSPDNHAGITPLEFFNYPNQALTARNSIIARLQQNDMPPAENDLGLPHGINNDAVRQQLIALAREFKAAGDDALAYEGEPALDSSQDPIRAGTITKRIASGFNSLGADGHRGVE